MLPLLLIHFTRYGFVEIADVKVYNIYICIYLNKRPCIL